MTQHHRGITLQQILIGCGTVVFILLVVLGIVSYFGYKAFKSRVSTSSPDTETKAREIMDYKIPEGSKGVFAMDLSKELGMKLAVIQSAGEKPNVLLVLGEVSGSMTKNEKSIEEQIKRSTQGEKNFLIEKMYTKPGHLCGEKATVVVKEGTMDVHEEKTPGTMLQSYVLHEGRGYFALVMSSSQNHEQEANSIFNSLHCK